MPLVSQTPGPLERWLPSVERETMSNSSLQHWVNDSVAEHLSDMHQNSGYIPNARKETEEEKTEEKEKSKF